MFFVLISFPLWKVSIVETPQMSKWLRSSSYCFCFCLQAFPRLAILVCNSGVVVGTQRPIQMHATTPFQLLLIYLAIGRLTLPRLCSCAVVLSNQLEQQAMWQPRLDSFWPFWIRKNHKDQRMPVFVVCFQSVIFSFIVCLLLFAFVCLVFISADIIFLWGIPDHFDWGVLARMFQLSVILCSVWQFA